MRWMIVRVATVAIVGIAAVRWYGAVHSVAPEAPVASATVQIERQLDSEDQSVRVTGSICDDDTLSQFDAIRSLRTLVIDDGIVSDQTALWLAESTTLQHVALKHSPIGDAGLASLASMPELAILNLPHAVCTDAGMKVLAAAKNLRQLRLGSRRLTPAAAGEIAEIGTLLQLHLIDVPIDDEGLKRIASLPRLESLYLDGSKVSASGWQWLFHHKPHLHVHINQVHDDRDPQRHAHR